MKNFVITGTQRTGSTALSRLLADHPETVCGLEWNQRVSWSKRIIACQRGLRGLYQELIPKHRDHLAPQFNPENRWIGYRNLFGSNPVWLFSPSAAPSLIRDRFRECIEWWRRDDIAIIHVTRADNLAWLRSRLKARQDKSYWANRPYSNDQVYIPVSLAKKTIEMKNWLDSQLAALQHTNPYLNIRHEDLNDIEQCASAVQNFLGISRRAAPAMPAVQSSGVSVEQHLANYPALRKAIAA